MANDPMKLTTLTVHDQQFEVLIDQRGTFRAVHDGREYADATLEGLRQRLTDATRRARAAVAVPFTEQAGLRDGVLVGVHQGNGNLLVRWAGQSRATQEPWSCRSWLRRLDDGEKAELRRLQEARAAACNALEAFVKPRLIEPRKLVEEAIKAQAAELAAREGR